MLSWSDIRNLLSACSLSYSNLSMSVRSQLFEYGSKPDGNKYTTLDITERSYEIGIDRTRTMAPFFADVVTVETIQNNIEGITLYAHQLNETRENTSLRHVLFMCGVQHITLIIPVLSCISSYEDEWTHYYETLCYDISNYLRKVGNTAILQNRTVEITLRFTDEIEKNTLPSGKLLSKEKRKRMTQIEPTQSVCPSDVNIVLKTYFEKHYPDLDELYLTWFIALYLVQSTPRSICYNVEHPFRALPLFMYKQFPFCVQRYMDQTDRCIAYGDIPPSPDVFHVGLIDRILERCKVE